MSKIVLFGLSRLISRQQFRTVHMGSWLSWESAAFATRRSRVRSPSGPPDKNRNFDTMRIKVAVLSFCLKALVSRAFRHLSPPVILMQSDSLPPIQSAKALGSSRLSLVLWVSFNLWAIVYS